jgi:hypothetical protein
MSKRAREETAIDDELSESSLTQKSPHKKARFENVSVSSATSNHASIRLLSSSGFWDDLVGDIQQMILDNLSESASFAMSLTCKENWARCRRRCHSLCLKTVLMEIIEVGGATLFEFLMIQWMAGMKLKPEHGPTFIVDAAIAALNGKQSKMLHWFKWSDGYEFISIGSFVENSNNRSLKQWAKAMGRYGNIDYIYYNLYPLQQLQPDVSVGLIQADQSEVLSQMGLGMKHAVVRLNDDSRLLGDVTHWVYKLVKYGAHRTVRMLLTESDKRWENKIAFEKMLSSTAYFSLRNLIGDAYSTSVSTFKLLTIDLNVSLPHGNWVCAAACVGHYELFESVQSQFPEAIEFCWDTKTVPKFLKYAAKNATTPVPKPFLSEILKQVSLRDIPALVLKMLTYRSTDQSQLLICDVLDLSKERVFLFSTKDFHSLLYQDLRGSILHPGMRPVFFPWLVEVTPKLGVPTSLRSFDWYKRFDDSSCRAVWNDIMRGIKTGLIQSGSWLYFICAKMNPATEWLTQFEFLFSLGCEVGLGSFFVPNTFHYFFMYTKFPLSDSATVSLLAAFQWLIDHGVPRPSGKIMLSYLQEWPVPHLPSLIALLDLSSTDFLLKLWKNIFWSLREGKGENIKSASERILAIRHLIPQPWVSFQGIIEQLILSMDIYNTFNKPEVERLFSLLTLTGITISSVIWRELVPRNSPTNKIVDLMETFLEEKVIDKALCEEAIRRAIANDNGVLVHLLKKRPSIVADYGLGDWTFQQLL